MPATLIEAIQIRADELEVTNLRKKIELEFGLKLKQFETMLDNRIVQILKGVCNSQSLGLYFSLIQIRINSHYFLNPSEYWDSYKEHNEEHQRDINSYIDSIINEKKAPNIQLADEILKTIPKLKPNFLMLTPDSKYSISRGNLIAPPSHFIRQAFVQNYYTKGEDTYFVTSMGSPCARNAIEQYHQRFGDKVNINLSSQSLYQFLGDAQQEAQNWGDGKAHMDNDGSGKHVIGQLVSNALVFSNITVIPIPHTWLTQDDNTKN